MRQAIRGLPDGAWVPATRQTGDAREGAHVAEITDQLDLAGYPTGARVLVRREPLHPGAQQTLDAAQDLMCFMANLCLHGDLRVAERARLRYQLLHVPARIVATGRRVILRLQHDWPWAQQLLTAYARLRRLHELVQDQAAEAAAAGDVRADIAPAELATFCVHALDAAPSLPSKAAARRLGQLTADRLQPRG